MPQPDCARAPPGRHDPPAPGRKLPAPTRCWCAARRLPRYPGLRSDCAGRTLAALWRKRRPTRSTSRPKARSAGRRCAPRQARRSATVVSTRFDECIERYGRPSSRRLRSRGCDLPPLADATIVRPINADFLRSRGFRRRCRCCAARWIRNCSIQRRDRATRLVGLFDDDALAVMYLGRVAPENLDLAIAAFRASETAAERALRLGRRRLHARRQTARSCVFAGVHRARRSRGTAAPTCSCSPASPRTFSGVPSKQWRARCRRSHSTTAPRAARAGVHVRRCRSAIAMPVRASVRGVGCADAPRDGRAGAGSGALNRNR